jgi:hypothetical protein
MYGILKALCNSRTGVRLGKFASGAKNLVWQALEFQQMGIFRKFPGERSLSNYGSNECFADG